MPHDAHTFNAFAEIISGWLDSLMLKPGIATCRRPVADQLPVSRRLVAEDSTAKVYIKSICDDRLTTVLQIVSDRSTTSRKPLQLVCN